MADTIEEIKGVSEDLKSTMREVDPSVELRKTKNELDKTMGDIKKAVKIKKPPVDR